MNFKDEKKYVATGSLETNKILKFDIITYDSRPSRANMQFKVDDIIFAKMKNTEKIFKIDTESSNHIYSTGFAGFRIKNKSDLLPKYLFYYLLSPCFQVLKDKKCTGTTQKAITNSKLKDFEIYVPSLIKQQETVDLIEKLLPLVDKYDEIEETLTNLNNNFPEEIKKSILQEAIQGKLVPQNPNDEPASVLLDKIKEEKERLIKEKKIKRNKNESIIYRENNHFYEKIGKKEPVCIDDEIPFDIPDSWEWTKIKNISEINPRNNIDDEMDVSFIPMPLINEKYSNSYSYDIRKWKDVKKGYTHFAKNDIAIAKITPCFENLKSVIFEDLKNNYGAGTTELHIIRPFTKDLNLNYLLWFFKSPYFIDYGVQHFSGTAGQKRIGKQYVAECYIPIPPLNEQKEIVFKLEKLINKMHKYNHKNGNLL